MAWTTDIGSKGQENFPELASLAASCALWAIALLIVLPRSGIALFPDGVRLTKWYGLAIFGTFAVSLGWFLRRDLSSADAALAAAAVYLCLGALFPAAYVLRKWRQERKKRAENESIDLEASVNLWAILAIMLALQFGLVGTFLYAKENKAKEAAAKESERVLTEQSMAIEALETALQAEKQARAGMEEALKRLTPAP